MQIFEVAGSPGTVNTKVLSPFYDGEGFAIDLEVRTRQRQPVDDLGLYDVYVTLSNNPGGSPPGSANIIEYHLGDAQAWIVDPVKSVVRFAFRAKALEVLNEGETYYFNAWSKHVDEDPDVQAVGSLTPILSIQAARPIALLVPPTLATPPSFSVADAEAGDTIGITPPTFAGTPPIDVALTLALDGVSVLDDLADDNGALSIVTAAGELVATWTASNAAGASAPVSISLTVDEAAVVDPAPTAANALPDLTFTQNSGSRTVDAAADFTNATGGTWSVTGAGATITQAGLVTVPDTAVLSAASVVVTYAKAGFPDATSAFSVTVEEEVVDPDPVTLAALTLSAASVAEDAAQGVVVGAVQGRTDGSSLTLTDTAGDRFALSGTNIITGPTALDYEAGTSHDITVRETLAGATNTPRETTLSIAVTDVADTEAPTLDAPLPDQTVTQGEAITPVNLNNHFSHPRETIAYEKIAGQPNLVIEGGVLSGTLGANSPPGDTTVTIRATAEGLNRNASFVLTVEETAVSPEMALTMTDDGFTGATVPNLSSTPITMTSEGFS